MARRWLADISAINPSLLNVPFGDESPLHELLNCVKVLVVKGSLKMGLTRFQAAFALVYERLNRGFQFAHQCAHGLRFVWSVGGLPTFCP